MDAAQSIPVRRWPRIAGIVFGLGTQVIFVATAWRLFWYLRDGVQVASPYWLPIDAALALQFAVSHSVLLLPSVRSRITRIVPASMYGSVFCLETCASLWLIFYLWRVAPGAVWNVLGTGATLIHLGFYASWIALIYSIRLTGLGYQTGWTQWLYWFRREPLPRRDFVERSFYRWLRHPVYLSFLGLIWFCPHMTYDHVVLTGVWTVYIFMGSYLKDRRLEFYLGESYASYARRVAGYPGMFFGPLGKWKMPPASPPTIKQRAA